MRREWPRPRPVWVFCGLSQAGISVQTAVRTGDAARDIVAAAKQDGSGLIALETHGHTGVAGAVLRTVAGRAVQQSGAPVLLVRTQQ